MLKEAWGLASFPCHAQTRSPKTNLVIVDLPFFDVTGNEGCLFVDGLLDVGLMLNMLKHGRACNGRPEFLLRTCQLRLRMRKKKHDAP